MTDSSIFEKYVVHFENKNNEPYHFRESLNIVREQFLESTFFILAKTSKSYIEDSDKSFNKIPYNVRIVREIKDNNEPNDLYLLMEYLCNGINLYTILEKTKNDLPLIEILNIMYQLCGVFLVYSEEIKEIPNKFYPFQFYLQGSLLKTDVFYAIDDDMRLKKLNIQKNAEILEKFSKKESGEKDIRNVIFFLGVVFHKLLTNNYTNEQIKIFSEIDLNDIKDQEIQKLVKEMLNVFAENQLNYIDWSYFLEHCVFKIKNIYNGLYGIHLTFLQETFMNCKKIRYTMLNLHQTLNDFHDFYERKTNKEDYKEDLICLNLILGYICLYFRKIIVKPLAYKEKLTNEMALWIVNVEKENQLYEEKFLLYYDIATEVSEKEGILSHLFKGEGSVRRDFSHDKKELQFFFLKNEEFLTKNFSEIDKINIFEEIKSLFLLELSNGSVLKK